jgi:hypothetical protein
MACYDFFLKQKYCDIKVEPFTLIKSSFPTRETFNWFEDQGIQLLTGYESEIGVLCTVVDITEDQALIIKLTFEIPQGELYDNA